MGEEEETVRVEKLCTSFMYENMQLKEKKAKFASERRWKKRRGGRRKTVEEEYREGFLRLDGTVKGVTQQKAKGEDFHK